MFIADNQKHWRHRAGHASLYAVLGLLLVFAQNVGLAHSHEGDLREQFDCEICLHAGAGEDSLTPAGQVPATPLDSAACCQRIEQPASLAAVPAKSRSPPHV